jgi:hypothetical protein
MMLDPSILNAPLLDHRSLDLCAARRVQYVLEQSFRCEYDAPVRGCGSGWSARHGSQYRRAHQCPPRIRPCGAGSGGVRRPSIELPGGYVTGKHVAQIGRVCGVDPGVQPDAHQR